MKPFIDSIAQGVSDIIGTLTEGYNTYIAPVLDYLAGKFTEVWEESIQPAINGVIELLGTVGNIVGSLNRMGNCKHYAHYRTDIERYW